jgi:hypothetical protein
MKLKNTALAMAFVAAASSSTFANDRLIEEMGSAQACARDVLYLCAGVEPAEGRIKTCVKEKIAQLSSCRWMVRPSR